MKTFIDLLRQVAVVLARFSESTVDASLKWNGNAYVPATRTPFDPYAAKWWARIVTISDLIENQDAPISSRQKIYLNQILFGGMGSFNDFMLDEQRLGSQAHSANQELNRLRKAMFTEFQRV